MKEIREWLEKNGGYAAGLALYETHGKSRVVVKSLRRGESEFTRATLRRELEKILAGQAPVGAAVRLIDASAERVRETPKRVQMAPAPASAPTQQRSGWFAERNRLHAQLELVRTDAERRGMGERILELSDLITASYEAAPLPQAAAPRPELGTVTDQGEIRRLLANLRPQASKLKKNPARAADLAQVLADIATLQANLLPHHE